MCKEWSLLKVYVAKLILDSEPMFQLNIFSDNRNMSRLKFVMPTGLNRCQRHKNHDNTSTFLLKTAKLKTIWVNWSDGSYLAYQSKIQGTKQTTMTTGATAIPSSFLK